MAVIYSWPQVGFIHQQDGYSNMIKRPLIATHHKEGINSSSLMKMVPHTVSKWGNYTPVSERLFMPFTFGANPVWSLGIEDGYLNHPYEPFTVLTYVVRNHYREMFDIVNGEVVENINDYNEVRDGFNAVFIKCKHGSGNSPTGQASVDEMIRMGSLFYILQQSCDNTKGLVTDELGRFLNPWGKRTASIGLDLRMFSRYSERLSGFAMSGFSFSDFCDKYIDQTRKNDLWLFNIPRVDIESSVYANDSGLLILSPVSEFMFLQIGQLVNMFKTLTRKDAYALALVEDTNGEVLRLISKHLGLYQLSNGLYKCQGMNIQVLASGALAMSNYNTSDNFFKKILL